MSKSVITTSLALVLAMTMVLAVGKTRVDEEEAPGPAAKAVIPVDEVPDIVTEESPVSVPLADMTVKPDIEQGEVILDLNGQLADDPKDPLMVSLANMQRALKNLQLLARETERAVSILEQHRSERPKEADQ